MIETLGGAPEHLAEEEEKGLQKPEQTEHHKKKSREAINLGAYELTETKRTAREPK